MSSFRRMLLFLLLQGSSKTVPLVIGYTGGTVILNAEGEGAKTLFNGTEVILNG